MKVERERTPADIGTAQLGACESTYPTCPLDGSSLRTVDRPRSSALILATEGRGDHRRLQRKVAVPWTHAEQIIHNPCY